MGSDGDPALASTGSKGSQRYALGPSAAAASSLCARVEGAGQFCTASNGDLKWLGMVGLAEPSRLMVVDGG